jgi:general secretion pathway protein F
MPLFAYNALTADGRLQKGEAEAASAQALASELAAKGLILAAPPQDLDKRLIGGGRALPRQKVTRFLGELALMLGSGLALDEALGLSREGAPPDLARAIDALRGDLHGGAGAAEAFFRQSALLGPEIAPLARVAEQTGDFAGVLKELSVQRQKTEALSEKISGGLRYPAFLFLAALSVALFFLLHVIPQFSSLVRDSGHDPGALVRGLFGLSDALSEHETALGVTLAVMLAAGLAAARSAQARKAAFSAFIRLPGASGTWELWRTTRLLNQLGLLLSQGVTLNAALNILEGIIGPDKEEGLRRAGDAIRRGERLAAAFAAEQLAPPLALRMLAIGEGSGDLARVAREAGALYAEKLERRLESIAQIVGPAAILVIALLIGGLMVAIMSALMSVNQSVT